MRWHTLLHAMLAALRRTSALDADVDGRHMMAIFCVGLMRGARADIAFVVATPHVVELQHGCSMSETKSRSSDARAMWSERS